MNPTTLALAYKKQNQINQIITVISPLKPKNNGMLTDLTMKMIGRRDKSALNAPHLSWLPSFQHR